MTLNFDIVFSFCRCLLSFYYSTCLMPPRSCFYFYFPSLKSSYLFSMRYLMFFKASYFSFDSELKTIFRSASFIQNLCFNPRGWSWDENFAYFFFVNFISPVPPLLLLLFSSSYFHHLQMLFTETYLDFNFPLNLHLDNIS